MEFLDMIESGGQYQAAGSFFATDGRLIAKRRSKHERYIRGVVEAAKLWEAALKSTWGMIRFREAMTSSDFPQLFGDVIDRQVLANYMATPKVWPSHCKRGTIPDFRTVKRFRIDGGTGILDEVAQFAPYPERSLTDDEYTYSLKKYGDKMGFSFESMVNDDLDALKDIPRRFALAAARTEDYIATYQYVDASGPHASMYTVGNANKVTSNPALSITALQTAMKVLGNMVDSDGQPIMIDMVELVVPPALEITALNILNATQLFIGTVGQGANASPADEQRLQTMNWMKNRLHLTVNPQIKQIATSANGDTSWFLFANPNNGRPAVEVGLLRGHENPEIFMKDSDAVRVGGGAVDAMAGSFEDDSIWYKVRHFVGATRLDPKMTVASNGSGS